MSSISSLTPANLTKILSVLDDNKKVKEKLHQTFVNLFVAVMRNTNLDGDPVIVKKIAQMSSDHPIAQDLFNRALCKAVETKSLPVCMGLLSKEIRSTLEKIYKDEEFLSKLKSLEKESLPTLLEEEEPLSLLEEF